MRYIKMVLNTDILYCISDNINDISLFKNFVLTTGISNKTNHYKILLLKEYLKNINNHLSFYYKNKDIKHIKSNIESVIISQKFDNLNWSFISNDRHISDDFVNGFEDFYQFSLLSRYHTNILDTTIIKYYSKINWEISDINSMHYRTFKKINTLDILIKNKCMTNWEIITNHPNLTQNFMLKYKQHLNFESLLNKKIITSHFYNLVKNSLDNILSPTFTKRKLSPDNFVKRQKLISTPDVFSHSRLNSLSSSPLSGSCCSSPDIIFKHYNLDNPFV